MRKTLETRLKIEAIFEMKTDLINRPTHYRTHPSGIECLTIASKMNFTLGNAFKYLFRCSYKGNALEDLLKADFYLRHALEERKSKHWIIKFWWMMCDEDCIDYNWEVSEVLSYETRYCGHMSAALDAVCVAGFKHGGTDIIERAIRSVDKMIKIEESKLS